ncbi:MAG TPA: glycosyltransferase [Solirubrobacteraceae bacterium]|nr:glycosyltransferase [Solirubrobacteraceae bacterium]
MRVLIFHGYLLEGTGSNVYNARLAAALVALGHEVHLLCQDRHPERQPFVDAVADWDTGELRVKALRTPVRCTVYRPDIGGLLPVYVADTYEGITALPFAQCSDAEVERYVQANVLAVRELATRVRPEAALANHLIMGPAILARGLRGAPYAVKVHGSALEYTVKPDPERFLGYAREGLAGAVGVLVGSLHTARSLWQTLADPDLPARTRLGPPGVDVDRFAPLAGDAATLAPRGAVAGLAQRLRTGAPAQAATSGGAFARDDLAAAQALERLATLLDDEHTQVLDDEHAQVLDDKGAQLVAFVGKLIVSKGVDLLLAAWPLVLETLPGATLAVVGFGAYRAGLERLLHALAAGQLGEALAVARAGRALEQPPGEAAPLRHLEAFLESLRGEQRERYLAAARALPERVVFVGRLDHEELAELLPVCEAVVVPSTFPEAFGMVAAEGAACGALPISAEHSGLAEVSAVLARAVPAQAAPWLSFPLDDDAVAALAGRLAAWLSADAALRRDTRAGLVGAVREHWSWEGVARGVLAAARGELDGLSAPR